MDYKHYLYYDFDQVYLESEGEIDQLCVDNLWEMLYIDRGYGNSKAFFAMMVILW